MHNLENNDYTVSSIDAATRRKRFVADQLSDTNRRDLVTVMASIDNILEATQSYSINLFSSNARVDSDRTSLTINILDINNGTLSIIIHLTVTLTVN